MPNETLVAELKAEASKILVEFGHDLKLVETKLHELFDSHPATQGVKEVEKVADDIKVDGEKAAETVEADAAKAGEAAEEGVSDVEKAAG